MGIDVEMAVTALHAPLKVDVLEVHSVLEIIVLDDVVLAIEAIAFLVLLENRAINPAVAVVVGELRVLELGIQLRGPLEEIEIIP